jgi:hypothetical protein
MKTVKRAFKFFSLKSWSETEFAQTENSIFFEIKNANRVSCSLSAAPAPTGTGPAHTGTGPARTGKSYKKLYWTFIP